MSIVDFNSTVNSELYEDYYDGLTPTVLAHNDYYNDLETKGSGVNIKFGLIVKPTDAWRIGVAFHTPTWYDMKDIYNGRFYFGRGTSYADEYSGASGEMEARYRFSSPWEYQLSTAYVVGTRGIISVEYDMKDYTSMKYKEDRDESPNDYFDYINDLIDDYMQPQHILKVGGELRVTPQVSLRAGYQFRSSPYKEEMLDDRISRSYYDSRNQWGNDDNEYMLSSQTKPNYSMLDDTHYATAGIGYRGKGWYVDLACVNRIMHEKVAAFPTTDAIAFGVDGAGNTVAFMSSDPADFAVRANHINMKTHTLSWDLTLGFKF